MHYSSLLFFITLLFIDLVLSSSASTVPTINIPVECNQTISSISNSSYHLIINTIKSYGNSSRGKDCNITIINSSLGQITMGASGDDITRNIFVQVINCTLTNSVSHFSFGRALSWPLAKEDEDQFETKLPQGRFEFIGCKFRNAKLFFTNYFNAGVLPLSENTSRVLDLKIDRCDFLETHDDPEILADFKTSAIYIEHFRYVRSLVFTNLNINTVSGGITVLSVVDRFKGPLLIENSSIILDKGIKSELRVLTISDFQFSSFPTVDFILYNNTFVTDNVSGSSAPHSCVYLSTINSINSIVIKNNDIRIPRQVRSDSFPRLVVFIRRITESLPGGILVENNLFFSSSQFGGLLGIEAISGDGIENRIDYTTDNDDDDGGTTTAVPGNERKSSITIRNNTFYFNQSSADSQGARAITLGGVEFLVTGTALKDFNTILVENNTIKMSVTRRVAVPQDQGAYALTLPCYAIYILDVRFTTRVVILNNKIDLQIPSSDYNSDALVMMHGLISEFLSKVEAVGLLNITGNTMKATGPVDAGSGFSHISRVRNDKPFKKVIITSNNVDLSGCMLIEFEARNHIDGALLNVVGMSMTKTNLACFLMETTATDFVVSENKCLISEPRLELYRSSIHLLVMSESSLNSHLKRLTLLRNNFTVIPLENDAARRYRYSYLHHGPGLTMNPAPNAENNIYQTVSCSLGVFGPLNDHTTPSLKSLIVEGNYMKAVGATLSVTTLMAMFAQELDGSTDDPSPQIRLENNTMIYQQVQLSPKAAGKLANAKFISQFIISFELEYNTLIRIFEPVAIYTEAPRSFSPFLVISELHKFKNDDALILSGSSSFIQVENNRISITSAMSDETRDSPTSLATPLLYCSFLSVLSKNNSEQSFGRTVGIKNNIEIDVSGCEEFQFTSFEVDEENSPGVSSDENLVVRVEHNEVLKQSSGTSSFSMFRQSDADSRLFEDRRVQLFIHHNTLLASSTASSFLPITITTTFSGPHPQQLLDSSRFISSMDIGSRPCNYILSSSLRGTLTRYFFEKTMMTTNDEDMVQAVFGSFSDSGCRGGTPTLTFVDGDNESSSNESSNTTSPAELETSKHSPVVAAATTATQSIAVVAAASAAAVAPSLGFGVARQQAMINFLQNVRDGDCGGVKALDGVPAADSPTQLVIGSSEARFYVGGVVGNFVLSFGIILLMQLGGTVVLKQSRSSSWNKPFAVFARCNVALVAFVCMSLLLSPTLTFTLVSLTKPDVPLGEKILVAIIGLLLVAIPTFYYSIWSLFLRSHIKQEKYRRVPHEGKQKGASAIKRLLTYWFEGEGEWMIPRKATVDEKLRFDAATPMIEGYNERAKWFGLAEFVSMLGLALAQFLGSVVPVDKSCTTVCVVLLITLGVFLMCCLYFRPFQELFNRIFVPIITVFEAAVIVIAYAFSDDPPDFIVTLAILTSSMQSAMAVIVLVASLSPLSKHIVRALKRFNRQRHQNPHSKNSALPSSKAYPHLRELLSPANTTDSVAELPTVRTNPRQSGKYNSNQNHHQEQKRSSPNKSSRPPPNKSSRPSAAATSSHTSSRQQHRKGEPPEERRSRNEAERSGSRPGSAPRHHHHRHPRENHDVDRSKSRTRSSQRLISPPRRASSSATQRKNRERNHSK